MCAGSAVRSGALYDEGQTERVCSSRRLRQRGNGTTGLHVGLLAQEGPAAEPALGASRVKQHRRRAVYPGAAARARDNAKDATPRKRRGEGAMRRGEEEEALSFAYAMSRRALRPRQRRRLEK